MVDPLPHSNHRSGQAGLPEWVARLPCTTYAGDMSPSSKTISSRGGVAVPLRSVQGESGLRGLAQVLAAPLPDVAEHFSNLLSAYLPHSALLILDIDDVRQPKKQYGDDDVVAHAVISELDAVRTVATVNTVWRESVPIAGGVRPVLAALAGTGALLLLTNPGKSQVDALVLDLWQILALRIHQHASEASLSYLMESRAASSVRTEAITELADRQTTTLESLLAVLRGASLGDRAARQNATDLAAAALVHLRTETQRVLTFTQEPVSSAFERLQDDLRPLVRYCDIDLQFVEPPVDGRALPSEIAHGARAVVHGAVLALAAQPDISRVRVQWGCDGKNLLINVRDDGPGKLTAESVQLDSLRRRVVALNGQLSLVGTEGWGTEMAVVMPLDPPPMREEDASLQDLGRRELEVLECLAGGLRNRAIAGRLGISENTVKFHVSRIFGKLGVSSRSEAAALALQRRIPQVRR